MAGLRSVWEPPSGVVDDMPEISERMIPIIMNHSDHDGNYMRKLRNNLRLALSSTLNSESFKLCSETYFSTTKDCVPRWFHDCFVEFTQLEGAFRDSLRKLLRNCISEVSVTTLIPLVLLDPLRASCGAMEQVLTTVMAREQMTSLHSMFPFGHEGVLPEILECVRFSCDHSLQSLVKIVKLIRGLGEPSFIWNEKWHYVSTKKKYRAFLLPKIEKHDVYTIAFNGDVVQDIQHLTESDIQSTQIGKHKIKTQKYAGHLKLI